MLSPSATARKPRRSARSIAVERTQRVNFSHARVIRLKHYHRACRHIPLVDSFREMRYAAELRMGALQRWGDDIILLF